MVSLWKHYPKDYSAYEHSFPPAFPWNREQGEDVPRYIMGEDGYWYDPKATNSGKALLSCTGDLMCEPRMTNANRYGDSFFFQPLFQYVRGILKSSDFSVGNLETTVTDMTPYAGEYHRVFNKYHCNAPECYLDAVRYAGFDALVTANNHNCDSGLMGLADTMDALDRHRFMHTGSFRPEDEERVLFVKINGIRVAILSYSNYYNMLDKWHLSQAGQDLWLNRYRKDKALRDIRHAKERGAEFVLCYIHWGDDYDEVPNEEQYAYLNELKDMDVDYIVGSHTHCLQSHSVVTGKNGKKIPLMFSMGNFVTNERKELCKHTGILQLILERKDGQIKVQEYFIPCYVFDEMGTARFGVVPADGMLNGGIGGEKMQQVRAYVRSRIGDDIAELPTGAITLEELCKAMGTELLQEVANRPIAKLVVYERMICPGALYFAMGELTEDEKRELRRRQVSSVVSYLPIEDYPCIRVPDVKQAYLAACRAVLARVPKATRILVAGREGKTLTRELVVSVLKETGRVLTVKDGYQIDSAPWQALHPSHDFCVQELRADNPVGAYTAVQATDPQICILTAMPEDFQGIVKALAEGSLLLVNGNDAALTAALDTLNTTHIRVISYGDAIPDCPGLPLPEMKNCAAAAYALGVELKMPEDRILAAISQFKVTGYTQNALDVDGINLVLNLNCKSVSSFNSALEVLSSHSGRKLAVLGDLDTETTPEDVAEMIASAKKKGATHIFYMGAFGESLTQDENVQIAADETLLEKAIFSRLQEGDGLLLNGGRKMNFNITLRRIFGLTDGFIGNGSW